MTDKERLEEIEKNLDPLGYGMGGHLISVNDIYWLVKYVREQSERVQELEQQNKRYREALTYYAEESNYDYDVRVDSISYVGDQSEMKFYRLDSEILYDRGKKARQVLEGEE